MDIIFFIIIINLFIFKIYLFIIITLKIYNYKLIDQYILKY